jgi:lipopolysaccharide export LptBFGC system permease protein LptF
MTQARFLVGLLGLTLLAGGLVFGVVVQRSGAPFVPLLGFALATYGAWLLVQAVRRLGEEGA